MILNYDMISNEWMNIFNKIPREFLDEIYIKIKNYDEMGLVYPPIDKRLNTFKYILPNEVKIMIIGQDPYINDGQAMGMSFSVPNDVKIPPSLNNIFIELKNDIPDFIIPENGDLTKWVKQGVLLLNNALTVIKGKSGSNSNLWEKYTNEFLHIFSNEYKDIIYILWGNHAKSKKKYIKNGIFIEGVHPSPLSAYNGFFNGHYFSKANEILMKQNKLPINWIL